MPISLLRVVKYDENKEMVPTVADVTYSQMHFGTFYHLTCPNTGRQWLLKMTLSFHGFMYFYDGPLKTDPLILFSQFCDDSNSRYTIQLPCKLQGKDTYSYRVCLPGREGLRQLFRYGISIRKALFGNKFQWRRKHMEENSEKLDSESSWELIRLSKKKMFRKLTTNVDEVVAIWKSKNGYGHFELRGSGLRGELGSFFPFLALATALTLEFETYTRYVGMGRSNSGGYSGKIRESGILASSFGLVGGYVLSDGHTVGGYVGDCSGSCGCEDCDGSCGDNGGYGDGLLGGDGGYSGGHHGGHHGDGGYDGGGGGDSGGGGDGGGGDGGGGG